MSEENEKMTDLSNVKGNGSKEEAESKANTNSETKASSSIKDSKPSNKVAVAKEEFKSLSKADISALDYKDFSTPARMLALGEIMVGSKLCIHKTKEDFTVAMMMGQELKLPLSASLSQIYAIDGKPSLGVHLVRAILLREGIIAERTEDYVTIYEYVKTDEAGRPVVSEVAGQKQYEVIHKGTLAEQPMNSAKRPIDTRTTYKFSRLVKRIDGNYKEITTTSSFTISEAVQAGLMEKANYKKHPKRMLDARAYMIGAREIADDLINGVMTPSELGANSSYTEDGTEVIEDITHEEVS
ncbi:MAG: hypothetical protein CMC35_03050 [Flavobacteriaceae bacterium]|nr:hypothetical protein [Flavobacteriaceae bacterium]|tara:strand:- start:225 stop:1118 length:894 start_codon:yes stop_codon:yes gene_type:complete